jgi:hypothetical protein
VQHRMAMKAFRLRLGSVQRHRQLSVASKCPVTGTSSDPSVSKKNPSSKSATGERSRPYSEIPGPPIYPLLGSILDFKHHGARLDLSGLAYYKKYGAISKQNISGPEVLIYDPHEYMKGKQLSLLTNRCTK